MFWFVGKICGMSIILKVTQRIGNGLCIFVQENCKTHTMKAGFGLLTALAVVVSMYQTMDGQSLWSPNMERDIPTSQRTNREIIPDKYHVFSLEEEGFQSLVNMVPGEEAAIRRQVSMTVPLPLPNGQLGEFIVWKAPVMEIELANRYPAIQSYKGYLKSDPSVTTRFSTGPTGFHGAIRMPEGMAYIDPYSLQSRQNYIVYYTSDHQDPELIGREFCGTTSNVRFKPPVLSQTRSTAKMELRKYRLALACTGEWGAVRGTKEKALAEMVIFVERANIVFEAELAITAVLIAKNDELIFLDGTTDPYTNPDKGLEILGQNTPILNGRIGGGSYEIGHVFSRCFDVGGVAGGNICTPGKGAGVTCHNGNTVTTGIVLVFNHEVGHQMTASHTFNKCGDTDQLALGTAYEPGSGSTIMAYPGACGSDNLGLPREEYYHVASLEQMLSFTNSEGADAYDCAEKIDIGNHVPVIDFPYSDGFAIPVSTPFYLKASATDENGDALKYSWEQFDNGTSSPLGSPTGNAPLFRSVRPGTSPARYFPNESRILNGQFTDKQELLPTYGRDLTFRFIVRDYHPMGTAAVWQEMKFKVAANAGPFKLTFPVLDYKWKIGQEVPVRWEVANTDKAPVNCSKVDIYMSLNNSLDFGSANMVLLAQGVPNDGSETVVVPNVETLRARIVVKAADNIFFTTGLYNSRIDLPATPGFFMDVAEASAASCLPEPVKYQFSTVALVGLKDSVRFEIVQGLPAGAVASFSKSGVLPGEQSELSLDLTSVRGTASYEMLVRAFVPGLDTIHRTIRLDVTGTDLDKIALFGPADGLSGVGPTQIYRWEGREDATSYELQVATSPSFATAQRVITRATVDTSFASNTFLNKATIYYWRVRSGNACRDGAWSETFAFVTEALNCTLYQSGDLSINISQSGSPKVEALLNVLQDAVISDVNIKNIRGDHERSGDLVAFLVAPSGKEALLWTKRCGTSKGFNVGLDDQSNEFFQCPINTGRIYRPESPLSGFNGENAKGNWTLRIEDRVSGSGGRLKNVDLELCANIVLDPPRLVRNEVLTVKAGMSKPVSKDVLLAEDNNTQPIELTYTLVQPPVNGLLVLNSVPLKAGDTFTQAAINNGSLLYIHTATNTQPDAFRFVVSDGQGGWVSITGFQIFIEEDSSSAEEEYLSSHDVLVYPNPVSDMVHISIAGGRDEIHFVRIVDGVGRLLLQQRVDDRHAELDLSSFESGVYYAHISLGKKRTVRKIVKQ
jgi:subtilisin-like proprotein convertase family protein